MTIKTKGFTTTAGSHSDSPKLNVMLSPDLAGWHSAAWGSGPACSMEVSMSVSSVASRVTVTSVGSQVVVIPFNCLEAEPAS